MNYCFLLWYVGVSYIPYVPHSFDISMRLKTYVNMLHEIIIIEMLSIYFIVV